MRSERSSADTADIALTIAVPNYNYGDFLEELLEAINASAMRDMIEVIVSDGGSTDRSFDVCKALLRPQDQLFFGRDDGQADAIDKALKSARGRWFMFQNSDDQFDVQALDQLVGLLAQEVREDVIAFDQGLLLWDETNSSWYRVTSFRHSFPVLLSQLAWNIYFTNQSTVYRTDQAKLVGFDARLRFALDYDFVVRFFKRFRPDVRYVAGVLGYQRLHDESKTSTLSDICRKETRRIRESEFSFPARALGRIQYIAYHGMKRLLGARIDGAAAGR